MTTDERPRVILNVDDTESGRYVTTRILRDAGLEVVEAGTGAEALRLVLDKPDLVLLDINLPDMNGFEVCARIKADKATAHIPVVHLSATYVGRGERADALEGGADAYLTQPVDPRELMATLTALMRLRETQKELVEKNELLDAIVQSSSDAIYVKDPDGRYLFFNAAAEAVTGQTAGQVLGRDDTALFPADEAREIMERDRSVFAGGVLLTFEETVTTASGDVRTYLSVKGPLFGAGGEPFGIFGVARDITERKRAEERTRESEQRYTAFIDATDDMAFLKDGDGRYVLVNEATADFFGMAPADVIGLRDEDVMEQAAAEVCRQTDQAAIDSGKIVIAYETIGDVVYETRKFPVQLARGGKGVGGYIRDVTAGRRAQEQIERLNAELESRVTLRTEELQLANRELESFSYSVSHDLRAPLRAIDGFSQIVLEDNTGRLDPATLEHLGRIRSSAQRMAGLIEDLLQLSRLGRKELSTQDVDVTALVEDVVAELQANEPDRTMDVTVARDMACKGDPELLRVVFVNLLGNAWKFTSHHETAHIAVACEASARSRVFSVTDDGAGFDMAYADKLFGAFQRLHSPQDFDGTGIGLATVQRIVARHHGRVWAEGRVDQGATFSFSLPDEPRG